jgi:hypothetical protein
MGFEVIICRLLIRLYSVHGEFGHFCGTKFFLNVKFDLKGRILIFV